MYACAVASPGCWHPSSSPPPTPAKSSHPAGTKDGYSGYGAEQGVGLLREKIATKLYGGRIAADEVSGGVG